MRIFAGRFLAMAMLVAIVSEVPSALADYKKEVGLTSVELTMLPQFCWRQMGVAVIAFTSFHRSSSGNRSR